MTLDELKAELEADIPLKLTQLQSEAANNPVLYAKWSRYSSDLAKQRIGLEQSKVSATQDAFLYYTGRGDDVCEFVYSSTELRTVIPAHETVQLATKRLAYIDAMIAFCDDAMESIKQRGFAIKNIIELRKFEAGG